VWKRGQSWVACYSHAIFAPRGRRSDFALGGLARMVKGMSPSISFLVFLVENMLFISFCYLWFDTFVPLGLEFVHISYETCTQTLALSSNFWWLCFFTKSKGNQIGKNKNHPKTNVYVIHVHGQ
jgi:hypothetical protein